MTIAVIADIVGSRRLDDRAAAQSELEEAIARAERDKPLARRPLTSTVGDELQGQYTSLGAALCGILLVQLALPDGLECRFGIGIGETRTVESTSGPLPEGPGWWSAREAIDHVRALERRRAPRARSWIVAAPGQDEQMSTDLANAYLLARDELVGAMSGRARRLTYGRCLGVAQKDLARSEGVTQPAVSQVLGTAGSSAVVGGFEALLPGDGSAGDA